jgi:hypothetical protein
VRFGAVARIKKGAAEMAGGKDMATSVQVGLANLREGKPLKKKARSRVHLVVGLLALAALAGAGAYVAKRGLPDIDPVKVRGAFPRSANRSREDARARPRRSARRRSRHHPERRLPAASRIYFFVFAVKRRRFSSSLRLLSSSSTGSPVNRPPPPPLTTPLPPSL